MSIYADHAAEADLGPEDFMPARCDGSGYITAEGTCCAGHDCACGGSDYRDVACLGCEECDPSPSPVRTEGMDTNIDTNTFVPLPAVLELIDQYQRRSIAGYDPPPPGLEDLRADVVELAKP